MFLLGCCKRATWQQQLLVAAEAALVVLVLGAIHRRAASLHDSAWQGCQKGSCLHHVLLQDLSAAVYSGRDDRSSNSKGAVGFLPTVMPANSVACDYGICRDLVCVVFIFDLDAGMLGWWWEEIMFTGYSAAPPGAACTTWLVTHHILSTAQPCFACNSSAITPVTVFPSACLCGRSLILQFLCLPVRLAVRLDTHHVIYL